MENDTKERLDSITGCAKMMAASVTLARNLVSKVASERDDATRKLAVATNELETARGRNENQSRQIGELRGRAEAAEKDRDHWRSQSGGYLGVLEQIANGGAWPVDNNADAAGAHIVDFAAKALARLAQPPAKGERCGAEVVSCREGFDVWVKVKDGYRVLRNEDPPSWSKTAYSWKVPYSPIFKTEQAALDALAVAPDPEAPAGAGPTPRESALKQDNEEHVRRCYAAEAAAGRFRKALEWIDARNGLSSEDCHNIAREALRPGSTVNTRMQTRTPDPEPKAAAKAKADPEYVCKMPANMFFTVRLETK